MAEKIRPEIFKAVRHQLGLSQAELGTALGVTRVTVNKYERGRARRGIPAAIGEKLLALANKARNSSQTVDEEPGPRTEETWRVPRTETHGGIWPGDLWGDGET